MSENQQSHFQSFYYKSRDGLQLFARDYRCSSPLATVICIPGLTRNSADFAAIGEHLAPHYRVLVMDLRGRGLSDYDPEPTHYQPLTYVEDVFALIDAAAIAEQVVLLGTSLGGLVSMLLTAIRPQAVRAVILNDVGPEIDPKGLARIQQHVGKVMTADSWEDAIKRTRLVNEKELPNLNDAQWQQFTAALYRQKPDGSLALAYDPAVIQSTKVDAAGADNPMDLWPQFAVMKDKPLLLIRGETSDIISLECVEKMQRVHPTMAYCEVAHRGHAPLLNEPESIMAIDQFLAGLDKG